MAEFGNNKKGTLGNGTNDDSLEPVQVRIDENTFLTNVIKISVGANHVLALTSEGKVYAWGENNLGQLGKSDITNSNYAILVSSEGSEGSLARIVDISAGNLGSTAINEFGWMFVWGNGSYGEMGNGTFKTKYIPSKSAINTAISASIGNGHLRMYSSELKSIYMGKKYIWRACKSKYRELSNSRKSI
ncbi:MAG: hypothetical protein HFJ50_01605 [Clostridia bacterium]|nr:hypothetical protein [Clostridia bacterium]